MENGPLVILVARHRSIDLRGPSLNSPSQISELLESQVAQLADRIQAPNAMVAVNNNLIVPPLLQLLNPAGQFTQRDQARTRQGRKLMLVRLTHIQQPERSPQFQGFSQFHRRNLQSFQNDYWFSFAR
jgi:hypothetical protein